jgi:hypothetical protein
MEKKEEEDWLPVLLEAGLQRFHVDALANGLAESQFVADRLTLALLHRQPHVL